MSVRATGSLIADVVVASGLNNSPRMVVQTVDEEAKLVTAVWFSDDHKFQQGVFPAGGLDRAEESKRTVAARAAAAPAAAEKAPAARRPGRPARK